MAKWRKTVGYVISSNGDRKKCCELLDLHCRRASIYNIAKSS